MYGEVEIFNNRDKQGFEGRGGGPGGFDFILPYRLLITARSGQGKTNIIMSIIKHRPVYDKIYLTHCDPNTKEYDDLDVERYEIGGDHIEVFGKDRSSNKLWCIDDIDFGRLTKAQRDHLIMAIRYSVSHFCISVIMTIQDSSLLPPVLRRLFSVNIIAKPSDPVAAYMSIRKASSMITPAEAKFVFTHILHRKYDFLLLDEQRELVFACVNNKFILLDDKNFEERSTDSSDSDSD